MTSLPIAPATAGAAALINAWLSTRGAALPALSAGGRSTLRED